MQRIVKSGSLALTFGAWMGCHDALGRSVREKHPLAFSTSIQMHVFKGVANRIRIGLGYGAYIEATEHHSNIAMYFDRLVAGFTL